MEEKYCVCEELNKSLGVWILKRENEQFGEKVEQKGYKAKKGDIRGFESGYEKFGS